MFRLAGITVVAVSSLCYTAVGALLLATPTYEITSGQMLTGLALVAIVVLLINGAQMAVIWHLFNRHYRDVVEERDRFREVVLERAAPAEPTNGLSVSEIARKSIDLYEYLRTEEGYSRQDATRTATEKVSEEF